MYVFDPFFISIAQERQLPPTRVGHQTFPPKKPSLRKLSPIPTVYLAHDNYEEHLFYAEFKDAIF
ncbi:unnamed protein product, partial [Pylaiella littoralis]